MHFNHTNIIFYANRPFFKGEDIINEEVVFLTYEIKKSRVEWMNEVLINNWNSIVNEDDLVYHLGDFCFKGTRGVSKQLENKLNGDIVHIKGNHDGNNGVKTYINSAFMEFGGKSIYAVHIPPRNIDEIPSGIDFVICGHVHDEWKHKVINEIPIINVGTDVWDYKPVSTNSLLKYYELIKNGIVNENGVKIK